jgi:hypothetical protein
MAGVSSTLPSRWKRQHRARLHVPRQDRGVYDALRAQHMDDCEADYFLCHPRIDSLHEQRNTHCRSHMRVCSGYCRGRAAAGRPSLSAMSLTRKTYYIQHRNVYGRSEACCRCLCLLLVSGSLFPSLDPGWVRDFARQHGTRPHRFSAATTRSGAERKKPVLCEGGRGVGRGGCQLGCAATPPCVGRPSVR